MRKKNQERKKEITREERQNVILGFWMWSWGGAMMSAMF